jgi:hypothetical protein
MEYASRNAVWRMNVEAVRLWLMSLGVGQHADAFARNRMDGVALVQLEPSRLVELGVSDPAAQEAILQGVFRIVETTSSPLLMNICAWDNDKVRCVSLGSGLGWRGI